VFTPPGRCRPLRAGTATAAGEGEVWTRSGSLSATGGCSPVSTPASAITATALACRHAERLGAAAPTRPPRGLAGSVVPHPLGLLQRALVDVDDHVSEGEMIGEQLAKLRGVVKQPDAPWWEPERCTVRCSNR